MARSRAFPIYIRGRKVAEAYQNNVDIESGDEQLFGAEGVLGLSEGITTFKLDFDYVVLTRGTDIADLTILPITKEEVGVGVFAGGKRFQVPMRATAANLTSATRNGTATGKLTLMSSGPITVT